MLPLDPDTLRKATRLGAQALTGEQQEPAPAPKGPPGPQDAPDLPPPKDPNAAEIPVSPDERKTYETRRADLIAHGGENLEKILTRDKYADVRKHFGLGDAAEYKEAFAKLSPNAQNELKHQTLRSIVSLDVGDGSNPHFFTDGRMLKRLLTDTYDYTTQIKDATGLDAKPYDPINMGEDEKALRQSFREQLVQKRIENGPELFIRYGEDFSSDEGPQRYSPPVSQVVLKDGTHAMIVGLNDFTKNKEGVERHIRNELSLGHFADSETVQGTLARYGKVPLKDLMTKPEFSDVRDTIGLPDFSDASDPKTGPQYFDTLDAKSLKLLTTKTLSDAMTLTTTTPGGSAYASYQYPTLNEDSIILPLIQPNDHLMQMQALEGIGDFGKTQEKKDQSISRVSTENLSGEDIEFFKNYADMATNPKKMGFDKPPELYVLSYDTGSGAQAALLKDGTRVIVMDQSVAAMPPMQRLDILGHEDGHLYAMMKKGQHDIYDLMKDETEKQKIKKESEADRFGSGSHGTYDAQGLLTTLKGIFHADDQKIYNQYIDRQLEDLAMGQLDHPLNPMRFDALKHEAQDQAKHPNYTPYYKPKTAPDATQGRSNP